MKVSFLFYLLTLSASIVSAQDSKFALGVEGSSTLVTLYGNERVDRNVSQISFSTGVKGEYFFSDHGSLKSGLLFARKGTHYVYEITDIYGQVRSKEKTIDNFDYITLPVLATFRTNGAAHFYVNGGFYAGYLIRQKTIYPSNSSIGPHYFEGTKSFRRIDLGLALGLGVYVPIGKKIYLDFGLNEELGLLNVVKGGSMKTNSLGLLLGLRYKL